MTLVREGRQYLEFEDEWAVVEWDKCDEYLQGIQSATPGVKASDVVAVKVAQRRSGSLLIAEFKDFTNPAIPPGQAAEAAAAATSDRLIDALVRKVIDSLSGATFSHDARQARSERLERWRSTVGIEELTILVLVCVEVPRSQAVAVPIWTKKLQNRLRWLGPRAQVVVTSSDRPFSGSGLTYRL